MQSGNIPPRNPAQGLPPQPPSSPFPPQGTPAQPVPTQGMPPQGLPPQRLPMGVTPHMPTPLNPTQLPPQGMPPQPPSPLFPPQAMPPQPAPAQPAPPQALPPQAIPPQGTPAQPAPPQRLHPQPSDPSNNDAKKPSKAKKAGLITAVTLIVIALVAAGVYFFVFAKPPQKKAPKPPVTSLTKGIKSAWNTNIAIEKGQSNKAVFGLYNPARNALLVFTPNEDTWKVTALDKKTGKEIKDAVPASLPSCDNDLEQPFEMAGGKVKCAEPKPATHQKGDQQTDKTADTKAGDQKADDKGDQRSSDPGSSDQKNEKTTGKPTLPEHSVLIHKGSTVTIVALPDPNAAQAVAAYKPDGTLIWVEKFDNKPTVGTDGTVVWAISQNEDGTEANISFFTGSTQAQKDPQLPEIKVLPKDFLKNFDFMNAYFPGVPDGADRNACKTYVQPDQPGKIPLRPIPDKPEACFVKLTDGMSKDSTAFLHPDYPLYEVSISTNSMEYIDVNGDGYLDAVFNGGCFNSAGKWLVVANPDDPDHPWVGLVYATQGAGIDYQGNGVWGNQYGVKIALHMEGKTPVLTREGPEGF